MHSIKAGGGRERAGSQAWELPRRRRREDGRTAVPGSRATLARLVRSLSRGMRGVRVGEMMSRDFVRVRAGLSPAEARDRLRRRSARHLLIEDTDGSVIGLVSDRELRLLESFHERPAEERGRGAADADGLRLVLSPAPLVTVSVEASLEEAARVLLDHGVEALPVVGAGRVVGVLTALDMLASLACDAIPRAGDEPDEPPARGEPIAASADALLGRCRRIAVVGLSPGGGSTSAIELNRLLSLPLELDVVAIHPSERWLHGLPCSPSLLDVPGRIDLVQVFPEAGEDLHALAAEAARKHAAVFWFEGYDLPRSVVATLRRNGIQPVAGRRLAAALGRVQAEAPGPGGGRAAGH